MQDNLYEKIKQSYLKVRDITPTHQWHCDRYISKLAKEIEKYSSMAEEFKKEFGNRNFKMLTFGCGMGYDVYFLKKVGINVVGLEIDLKHFDNFLYNAFNDMRNSVWKTLNISNDIAIYSGYGKIPFIDNRFDLVLCVNSILRDYSIYDHISKQDFPSCTIKIPENLKDIEDQKQKERFKELNRIITNEGIIYIIPIKQYTDFKDWYNIFKEKNITVKTRKNR